MGSVIEMKRGLSKVEAAEYIGVGTTKFDEMVNTQIMPSPRLAGNKTLWDLRELDDYFERLPLKGQRPAGVWS